METSAGVATWLSFGVTTLGLAGLITQIGGIADSLDPFHDNRSAEYLGLWLYRPAPASWSLLRRPPPEGPVISAGLTQGFCGHHVLYLSRLPLCLPPGKAPWAIILAIFHAKEVLPRRMMSSTADGAEKAMRAVGMPDTDNLTEDPRTRTEWHTLKAAPLLRYDQYACVTISRTTLITMMIVTNARKVFEYSEAAGYRAGYGSYNGQWYITWPLGREALVRFAPHDSHHAATDVYPPCFMQRVDRCAQMVAGVVLAPEPSPLRVAFCGRQGSGSYVLEHVSKGFPGAHGSRHLYNMLGGKVYEVDYIFARRLKGDDSRYEADLQLDVPSKDNTGTVRLFVPAKEQGIIAHALDCLPWNHMSWSIHRGLRDIVLAFARSTMDNFRPDLAKLLKDTVREQPYLLEARGWHSHFVRNSMGEMAASAVLAGQGNSGDLVRVVTDIMRVIVRDWPIEELDDVTFWRKPEKERCLDLYGAVALTKVFVLEWSNEFDYQMYHNLPISLHFG